MTSLKEYQPSNLESTVYKGHVYANISEALKGINNTDFKNSYRNWVFKERKKGNNYVTLDDYIKYREDNPVITKVSISYKGKVYEYMKDFLSAQGVSKSEYSKWRTVTKQYLRTEEDAKDLLRYVKMLRQEQK